MIRQQYHFRHSEQGLLSWDVRRLIELSEDLPVFDVEIEQIAELDEDHWYAHGDNTPTCRSIAEHALLMDQADLRYPIILDAQGRVMDGMHRVCRALRDGHRTIKAVQFKSGPTPDYIGVDPKDFPYD